MQIAPKRLNIRNSSLTHVLQGQAGHDPLKIFRKGGLARSRDPLNFWALNANSSKRLKLRTSNLTRMFPETVRT